MNIFTIFAAEYLIFIAALYAVLHVLLKHEKKHHIRHIASVLGGAVCAWVIAHFLKDLIAHPRPDLSNALVPDNDPYSFPSGHTTFMFTLAFIMHSFDKRAAKILFVLALATGVSRVLVGVHYWYDIVGGIVVAFCVAYMVTKVSKRFFPKA